MKKYFAHNLAALLNKTNMSPYTLAEYMSTEPSTIYRWINPDLPTIPRSRTRVVLGEIFGVDPNELTKGYIDTDGLVVMKPEQNTQNAQKKRTFRNTRVPLVKAGCGLTIASLFEDDIGTEEDGLAPAAIDWLPAAPDRDLLQERTIAVRQSGSAVAPTVNNGDLVYIDFAFGGAEKPTYKEGDLVLAEPLTSDEKHGQDPVIRKLVYGDNEQDLWLTATNPDWPGTRTVKARFVLGKVVAIFRKL